MTLDLDFILTICSWSQVTDKFADRQQQHVPVGLKSKGSSCKRRQGQIPSLYESAQLKPSELTVKVIDDCVVVEEKHEERGGRSWIHFSSFHASLHSSKRFRDYFFLS